jgi:hypothetical protein
MPLVILHHLLNVSVQLANKRGLKKLNFEINFSLFLPNENEPMIAVGVCSFMLGYRNLLS